MQRTSTHRRQQPHVERGESPIAAAERELLEEAGLSAKPEALVGVYTGPSAISFVFHVPYGGEPMRAGADMMDIAFVEIHSAVRAIFGLVCFAPDPGTGQT